MSYNIAIDGPAGAGKSTIAKKVASELQFLYVDTGAMYRAMACYFIRNGISEDETEKMASQADQAKITLKHTEEGQQVFLDEENITHLLREEAVGRMASVCSAVPQVREALLSLQKDLAAGYDVVMDGRDIGTNILPQADLKIFLTASSQTRARRRFDELSAKGVPCDQEQIEADIIDRDRRDMSREIAPLRQADDAHYIDSSHMTIDEVTETILNLYHSTKNS